MLYVLRCWRYLIPPLLLLCSITCVMSKAYTDTSREYESITVLRGTRFIGCNSSECGLRHKTVTVLWNYINRKLGLYGNLVHFIQCCVSVWACWQASSSRQGQTFIYSAQQALSDGATCSHQPKNVWSSGKNKVVFTDIVKFSTLIWVLLTGIRRKSANTSLKLSKTYNHSSFPNIDCREAWIW